MAIQYKVNIQITAGCDFRQEFTLANPDLSPLALTGAKVHGAMGKHPEAIKAYLSTSEEPVHNFIPFTTTVVDGNSGIYSIGLTAAQTTQLNEGKYVYNVVLEDVNGILTEAVSGLCFVEKAFATLV